MTLSLLSISVLGALHVTLDGQPVTGFESARARALLVYLAVESDRPHSRDALAGLLWPDESDRSARNNLRQTLANIRQVIGDRTSPGHPFLHVTRDAIQFQTSSDHTLDLDTFSRLLATCASHAHRHPEGCKPCADRMQRAVELYRGDLLDHFFLNDSAPFEEWALVQRESLRRRILEALTTLAEYHARRGAHGPALRFARHQLELDPWREEAHRQAMYSLALSGQRRAALAQYETCRRVLAEELKVEPSAETAALYEGIKAGGWTLDVGSGTLQLPTPPTPFIGREAELAELANLLTNPACRLVSIVGPGGVGKTRLALAAAAEQAVGFRHGVAFVPLASISSPDLVISAILAALGVPPQGPRDPKDHLLAYLREREVLLLLDNWEHLGGGTPLLSELLRKAPHVALLVTSRERLNLQGEWVLDLAGLKVPKGRTVAEVEQYSAVELFLQSARRGRSGCSFSDEEKSCIVRICRLVEGMPLAIELAAAWVRSLSCRQIAEEIEKSYGFLTAGPRDLPERHRSMRAVFEHSWGLLGEEEQGVFGKLSVFRGGFRREAAEQIAGASLSILTALIDKSLVRSNGADRYDLHELLRQFAEERLAERGQCEDTRDRHLAYGVDLAEQAEPHLTGPRQKEWLDRLHDEHDNLRAALGWALESQQVEAGLRLAGALWRFWYIRGGMVEGRRWLEQMLEYSGAVSPASRAKALAGAGWIASAQCDYAVATRFTEQALALQRELKDTRSIAVLLNGLGVIASDQGDTAQAKSYLQESLGLFRALGDEDGLARSLDNLANLAFDQGDTPAALALHEESLVHSRKCGDRHMVASSLLNLGWSFLVAGDPARALSYLVESFGIFRELGDHIGTVFCLEGLAGVAGLEQKPLRAAQLFGGAAAIRQTIQAEMTPVNRVYYDPIVARVQKQLTPAAFAAAWEQGCALTIEQAITLALNGLERLPEIPS